MFAPTQQGAHRRCCAVRLSQSARMRRTWNRVFFRKAFVLEQHVGMQRTPCWDAAHNTNPRDVTYDTPYQARLGMRSLRSCRWDAPARGPPIQGRRGRSEYAVQCGRTAGAEWPWLKPTEPARVAEVVHCRTKQHHELVHRCEVLRKLQPTSLHSTRTLCRGGGPGHNEAERRGGGAAGGRGGAGVRCMRQGSSAPRA